MDFMPAGRRKLFHRSLTIALLIATLSGCGAIGGEPYQQAVMVNPATRDTHYCSGAYKVYLFQSAQKRLTRCVEDYRAKGYRLLWRGPQQGHGP